MDLRQFPCDPLVVRDLLNSMPTMWTKTSKIFESIITKIPKHKYNIDKDTRVMKLLSYPYSELDTFYDLEKHLMPYPSYYIMYPPLRYVKLLSNSH